MTTEEYTFTVIACVYGFVIVCFCLFGLYECIFGTKQEEYDFEIFDVNVNDLK